MTTIKEINEWVTQGESETQEFKQTTGQRTEAAKTLCAMLNHKGGRVIFGVDQNGRVIGQSVTDKTIEDVVHEIRAITPPVYPHIERVPIDHEREVIVVTVKKGTKAPYSINGKPYKRVGTTKKEMTADEGEDMILERRLGVTRWENQIADGWSLDDLDFDEILATLEEGIRRGRTEEPRTRNIEDILTGFKLLDGDKPLRAAVVLFGKSNRLLPGFPQCQIKLAKFKGTDKSEFFDNRLYEGNAFELLRKGESFIRDNIPIESRFVSGKIDREDIPLYPPLATREALSNALCHRDYSIIGGAVTVGLYSDKLEITSPGKLHFGITVEDLYRTHESKLWNPLIAGVFYRRGFIETWGRGTNKIADLAVQAGLARPEFEERTGSVVVRFRVTRYQAPERSGHDLSERQRQILSALEEGKEITLAKIHEVVGKHHGISTIKKDLAFLKQLNLVNLKGAGRGARWSLKGVKISQSRN